MNTPAPPGGSRPPPAAPDESIPILMEPVAEAAGPAPVPAATTASQQSLFADDPGLPPSTPRPRRPRAPDPAHLRAASHLLAARAPAIIDEVLRAHAPALEAALRQRLHEELEALLSTLSGDPPPAP